MQIISRKKIILFSFYLIAILTGLAYLSKYGQEDPPASDHWYTSDSIVVHLGKVLFEKHCSSCHGIREEGFGPRLGGITTIIPRNALIDFVTNPGLVINAGDPRAIRQQEKYRMLMPSFEYLAPEQITEILSYVDHQTQAFRIEPLVVDTSGPVGPKMWLVPPITKSRLGIELEEFGEIPRAPETPPDKGIATLRPHPSADGTLFVSDQMGIIYRLTDSTAEPFLDITGWMERFIYTPGIGTGLGSFAFHPGFVKNGLIYTTHAEEYTGKSSINDGAFPDSVGVGLQWVLSEWKLDDPNAKIFHGSVREVLRLNTPTTAHGVQDIGFVPGLYAGDDDYGNLYLGIGDGGSNNIKLPELCHNLKSLLGTIIRIDPGADSSENLSYTIPANNPFAMETDPLVRKEIWAYGFRNPHRMCWDLTHGNRMLVADIGESNIEEINIVEKGGDYGWSTVEGTYGISTKTNLTIVYPLSKSELELYNAPFGQYDHNDGNAISGGFVYQGPYRVLQDKYFFGDIVNGKLLYMNLDQQLTDSSVYEIAIVENGLETNLKEISHSNRVHLRIGYDLYSGQLFIMTKGDGKIRRVASAYNKEDEI